MQKHNWQTVAANYRERVFWILVIGQMYAFYLFVVPNPSLIAWAKDQMGSWYYDDFIWMVIWVIVFGCILIISKALEKLAFLNLEQ
jgi:hypothetical protein